MINDQKRQQIATVLEYMTGVILIIALSIASIQVWIWALDIDAAYNYIKLGLAVASILPIIGVSVLMIEPDDEKR